jgi:hypothetical protein
VTAARDTGALRSLVLGELKAGGRGANGRRRGSEDPAAAASPGSASAAATCSVAMAGAGG